MNWTKWIGLALQLIAVFSGLRAGQYHTAAQVPGAEPGLTVQGVPATAIGYGGLAAGLACAGTAVAASGKSKQSAVQEAIGIIASDAARRGDCAAMDKTRDLAFVLKATPAATPAATPGGKP